ncbi:MAG: SDR family oxidoreductase [Bacteroidia bacterium]|nr:SDR family oxidoreductase [Bacteroidia bacterium]
MKIMLIGGTGKTGKQIIKQALESGHEVTALIRNPKKVKISNPNLVVVKGDVLVPETLEHSFSGHEVVISALGHKKFFIKTTILSRGTQNIIRAMQKNQLNRFICITSLGINDSRFKLGLYYTLFVIPFIILFYFLDKEKQERLIQQSDLDWTIVRPGQLTNGRRRGRYKHGKGLGSYILTKMISRADVAHFIIGEAENNSYIRKVAELTY